MFLKNLSLKKKLIFMFVLMSIIPVLIIAIIGYNQFKLNLNKMVDKQTSKTVSVANYYFSQKVNEVLDLTKKYSQKAELIDAFKNKDRGKLDDLVMPIFTTLKEDKEITVFEFGDENGVVFTRGHHPGKYGDDKSSNESIGKALKGEEVAGFEFGSSGLAIRAFVPLKSNNKVIGTLQLGTNLNEQMLKDINRETGGNVSLYENDVLITTLDSQEQSKIGQKLKDSTIFKRVSKGEQISISTRNGGSKIFYPLYDPTSTRVQGMISINQDLSSISEFERSLFFTVMVIFILILVITLFLSIFLGNKMISPLIHTTDKLKAIAKGDLTVDIQSNSEDEIGELLKQLEITISSLKSIIKSIKVSASAVTKASDEITLGSQYLSKRTQEQASAIEETSSAIEQLTATVKQNADNAKKANTKSESAVQVVTEGNGVIKDTISAMQEVNVSSKKISEIINVVNDIAFQTNLLALNAAVEAARAGEQGRGFAVVAVEVRNLAGRSADAAKEIQTLINDSVTKIENGNELVLKTGEKLNKITESMKEMSELISEISAASQEQSLGIQEVSKAIIQMDESVQQNASLVEESATSCDIMNGEAKQLTRQVEHFKINE